MPSFPLGAFVWTNFPFSQPLSARSQPGPTPHIAYHLGSQESLILLAYTSSGTWRGGSVLPPGIVTFDEAAAASVGQKPFHLDLRTLARVALTDAWFPRLATPSHGVVGVASKDVQRRVIEAARSLTDHGEIVEYRGIGSDTTFVTRRRR